MCGVVGEMDENSCKETVRYLWGFIKTTNRCNKHWGFKILWIKNENSINLLCWGCMTKWSKIRVIGIYNNDHWKKNMLSDIIVI